jgi:hypothetical protein
MCAQKLDSTRSRVVSSRSPQRTGWRRGIVTFSRIPPTGVTAPLSVISPVIAVRDFGGIPRTMSEPGRPSVGQTSRSTRPKEGESQDVLRETIATTMATPALGPSFLTLPAGR